MRSMLMMAGLLVVTVGAGGCEEERAKPDAPAAAPRVQAETSPTDQPSEEPAGDASRHEGDEIAWDTPAGWQMGPEKPMRYATLTDGQAEIAVSVFPGDVGGMLANVNRWRGQIGLAPVAENELPSNVRTVEAKGGGKLHLVDLKGTQGQRMLVAALPAPDGSKMWFFKLQGAEELVSAREEPFNAVVRSARLATGAAK